MRIETERLELVPLTAGQLKKLCEDMPALEAELDCTYMAEPMEGHFLDIVRGQLEITKKDPKNYIWHSFWLIIRKNDRIVVGSADFKDIPDEKGETEIGYGLGKAFEHKGYMSETVKAMCYWALCQPEVSAVIAETDAAPQGLASQRVLDRCGFEKTFEGESLWWRLEDKNY